MDIISALQFAVSQALGPSAIFFALLAIGLNVHFGYGGLLNFGQIGFALVGAYSVGILVITYEQSLWLAIVVGLVMSGVLALVLGVPTLRLRADYLAIVTIASSEILRLIVRSPAADEITAGTRGFNGFAGDFFALNPFNAGQRYGFFGITFTGNDLFAMIVGWIIVILLCALVYLLSHSPWGRVLKAIREDEDAARSLGKNAFIYRMQALILGGVIGGFGGIFNALATQSVQPDFFSTLQTFLAFGAMVLGGAATVFGPVLGAMLIWFLLSFPDELLRQAVRIGYLPLTDTQASLVRYLLLGLAIALLMVFRPQGVLGNKREVQLDV